MVKIKRSGVQPFLDKIIDKLILWSIPRWVTPNQVTIVRFIMTPFVYWLLVNKQVLLALVVFVIAALTDAMDGAMARTRNQITDLGKMLDPVADKLLILSILLFVGFKYLVVSIFIVFIIFEVVAVLSGYFLAHRFGKPMGSNVYGKVKLILQTVSIGLFMLGWLTGSDIFIEVSKYVLFVALFCATLAGLEVARLKLNHINKSQADIKPF